MSRFVVRFLRYFCLLVGFTCLGIALYDVLDRSVYQDWENRAFDRSLEDQVRPKVSESPAVAPSPSPVPAATMRSAPVARTPPASHGDVIGRISVPRLGLRAIVDEGIDNGTLRRAVGHLPGTAYPGQQGNVALAGHRDTFFRDLRQIEKNDEIEFETRNKTFRYRVESIVVVDPSNTEVLAPSTDNVLTLVTCYPFYYVGDAPRRFIVRARQLGTAESGAPTGSIKR